MSANLSLAVIKNVVVLLLGGVHNGLVAHTDGVNAFDLDVREASKHLNGVDHVCDLLQTLAEGIKLAKNVVLTGKRSAVEMLPICSSITFKCLLFTGKIDNIMGTE